MEFTFAEICMVLMIFCCAGRKFVESLKDLLLVFKDR